MITAAQISITAIDHHHAYVRYVGFSDLLDEARQLSRAGIIFSANTPTHCRFFRFLIRRHALGKHAQRPPITDTVAAQSVAYDIVGEHCLDVSSVLLRQLS